MSEKIWLFHSPSDAWDFIIYRTEQTLGLKADDLSLLSDSELGTKCGT